MSKAPIDQYIIDRVRDLRKKNNMSRDDLAFKLGVSKGFIGNVESPKFVDKYSTAQLNELAKIFGCSPKDFLPAAPL